MEQAAVHKRQFSALNSHRVLLTLVMAFTALEIAVSVWSVFAVREEMAEGAYRAVQSRVDQVYDQLSGIDQSLKRILVEAYNSGEIGGALSADPLTRIQNRSKLISRCGYLSADAGEEFMLFYYFQEAEECLVAHHSGAVAFDARPALEEALLAYIDGLDRVDVTSGRWELVQAGEDFFAVRVYRYNGAWIGSCVPVESLIAPLRGLYPGQAALPLCITPDNEIVAGGDALEEHGVSTGEAAGSAGFFRHGGKHWMAVEAENQALGFRVRLLLPEFGQFERIVAVQTVSTVVVGAILCIVILSMAYTQRRILRPLRAFTDGLKSYDPDSPLLPTVSGEITELADANESFSNLIKEIQRLRIDAYERELRMQKARMDYMQLQIRPHFFLNSLNLIHTMAERGDTGGVAQLSGVTADYLRYLFQSDGELVPLAQELAHTKDYLSIMELRYPERFSCEIVAEPEAEEQVLPPLLLQTFVENAIKYAMLPDRRLEITVSALCEELPAQDGTERTYLTIFITDNGDGFPPELLQAWEAGRQLAHTGGKHIGIANAAQRLQFAYRGQARLLLYNSPLGGAVAELHIPCAEKKEEQP